MREDETLYASGSNSKTVEKALNEAARLRKLKAFMKLKDKIAIDEDAVKSLRKAELKENENYS